MINIAKLSEVCGDPFKKDARLLWYIYWDMRWLDPNNTEEIGSYESRIIANDTGYAVHSEGERIIEVVRQASPYSNLQAAAEKVRTAHSSDVLCVKGEGVTVEQYRRVLGPRYVDTIPSSENTPQPPPRPRGRRFPVNPSDLEGESRSDRSQV